MLFIVLMPMLVIAGPTPIKSGLESTPQSIGLFEISILKDGQWKQVGNLEFNKFLREQKLDLGQFLPAKGEIRLKLIQKGGGAAHIDTVLLGGIAPQSVSGSDDQHALKKLARADFDVLDGYQKTLELNFPTVEIEKALRLKARVEPEIISKTPFQFPSTNLFRPIDQNSRFYKFRLQLPKSALSTDKLEKIKKPFLGEFCRTGSGHPHGFTYGWVNNDQKVHVQGAIMLTSN